MVGGIGTPRCPRVSPLRDLQEAERLALSDRGRDFVTMNAECTKSSYVTGKRPFSAPPWRMCSISMRSSTRRADRLKTCHAGESNG